jgi:hypothetical protein
MNNNNKENLASKFPIILCFLMDVGYLKAFFNSLRNVALVWIVRCLRMVKRKDLEVGGRRTF